MIDNPSADSAARDGAPVEHGSDAALDRLNLEQALRDFEVANRRVVDLTHRLAGMHRELLDARVELHHTRSQLRLAKHQLARLAHSNALAPLRRVYRAGMRLFR